MRKGVSKYADPKYIGQRFGDRTGKYQFQRRGPQAALMEA